MPLVQTEFDTQKVESESDARRGKTKITVDEDTPTSLSDLIKRVADILLNYNVTYLEVTNENIRFTHYPNQDPANRQVMIDWFLAQRLGNKINNADS